VATSSRSLRLSRRPPTATSTAPRIFADFTWAATALSTAGRSRCCSTHCSGFAAAKLTRSPYQRTAFLHINYRQIVPIEKDLQVDGGIERIDGRKIFVQGRLTDGDVVLADGEALFVRLRPGQP
jgi:acyl-CoA thioesterase FadM